MNMKKIFKEKKSIEILKILGLINKENINQEFRLEKIDEINNLIEEINRNELISKKHKTICRVLDYIDHSLFVISTITGCVSISAFASLVGIPIVTA